MASHIHAGISPSKWVNPPNLSPYKNCTIPVPPYRALLIYIRLMLNFSPFITPFPFNSSRFTPKNQGLAL